jgi:hypothetical protein
VVECLFLIMTIRVHLPSRIDGPEVNTQFWKSLSCLRRLARELGWRHPLRRYEQAPIRLISDQM